MLKFNKHHVTNGVEKARCHYSLDNRVDGRPCVTIYAKDYDNKLGALFAFEDGVYKNETDMRTDYFEAGRVVLFEDHPLYKQARSRAVSFI
ncbi:hypothetical protein Dalk_4577 [Desulfatibacillum aliphaticivorans]|uniref:Uncharacterized protein n=1 Tax=Desulfatibacillum aliphaticivorans TaxID=218208 RepID=B8FNH4_DESAL|nr:hypothetical protein [Desulfatibacillum aliphaticivorans]ACL06255.1 hypothetical protein Dalk_4577 [Desulfatibacillum aliphaticivorans]